MPVRIVSERSRPVGRAPRPEGGPLPWEIAGGKARTGDGIVNVHLYIHREVVDQMVARSRESAQMRREDMGLLLGDWALDQDGTPYTVAMDLLTGPLESSPASVRFRREGLVEVARGLDALAYPYVIVGWYHTHLGLGCFLSERDVLTQRGGFPHRHQVAVVVDPVRNEAAGFANSGEGPGTVRAIMASYRDWEGVDRLP